MSELVLRREDISLLKSIGIDVINPNRRYWFLRTQSGTYFNDFLHENFVGIEWDEVSDINFIKSSSHDDLKKEIQKQYPKITNSGYISGQIRRFVLGIQPGDIVLIPSEKSGLIAFGEILGDVYIYEEDEFEQFLNAFDDEQECRQIIKKRRPVRWLHIAKKSELDPYLYRIIYSHNTIIDITVFETFIDRTLSQFYIKGDTAYLTYKVNRKTNIPYSDVLSFLNNNLKIIDFINKYDSSINIDINDIILKMNVQSKGPIQFTGKMKSVLVIGLAIALLVGAEFKINFLKCCEVEYKTEGIPGLLRTISEIFKDTPEKEKDIAELQDKLEKDIKNLQIQLPERNHNEILIDASDSQNVDSILTNDESE